MYRNFFITDVFSQFFKLRTRRVQITKKINKNEKNENKVSVRPCIENKEKIEEQYRRPSRK